MQDSPSLWPLLTGLLGSLASVAALWGVWLAWRRAPVDHRLITVQTEVAEATRGKTEAESSSLAFGVVSKALADAERTIDRLREQRDAAEAREKMLELELRREVALRHANELQPPPGEGKGS